MSRVNMLPPRSRAFRLLDDQPYPYGDDPLGFDQIARDLANIIRESRDSTPLAIGIESGWGMGKSTLMRQLEDVLAKDKQITTVWFNAWTADQGRALEGLVKSVLDRLDRNILRRIARNERLLSWARVLSLVVADWLKLGSLVNTLWREVSIDPKARNDMRELVVKSMREWVSVRGELGPGRLLVVFVDDLDRCPPVNVLQIFEALKLYLDAPGLVFVVGYDREVVSDAILDVKQYADSATSYHYLEKIMQITYRLPSVGDEAANDLVKLYLQNSATELLFDDAARRLTIKENGRNPRRIKRFINAFVLEYGLDPEWEEMGPDTLVRVLIIDVYFPDFGRLLRADSDDDPIANFHTYFKARNTLRTHASREDRDGWQAVEKLIEAYGLAAPDDAVNYEKLLEQIEREMPPSFPDLARNPDFSELIGYFTDVKRLRNKLRRFSASIVPQAAEGGLIYISYSRSDSTVSYAVKLSDQLRDHFGADKIIMNIGSLIPGADARSITESAIGSAAIVITIIGPCWQGPWLDDPDSPLRHELELALAAPATRVIPVFIGGMAPPISVDLPQGLAALKTINAISLSDERWDNDILRLINAIEYWLSHGTLSQEELQRLRLQESMESMMQENETFATISNVLKQRHDAVKQTIRNIR